MFQISANTKIRVAHSPINFKFGIDGIVALVQRDLSESPFNGHLYLFRNASRTMIRCLYYDGQGFYLCTKRLSKGKFPWWPTEAEQEISIKQFQVLLWAGNPAGADFQPDWRKIA